MYVYMLEVGVGTPTIPTHFFSSIPGDFQEMLQLLYNYQIKFQLYFLSIKIRQIISYRNTL